MQLPADLRAAAESFAEGLPFGDLKRAAALLSEHYRDGAPTAAVKLAPAFRVAAYMVARFPATYAAVSRVLREIPFAPGSILDLAAGSGAAALAARKQWPDAEITLIESDTAFADAGRKLLPGAHWITADLRQVASLPPADLVIASYGLGELGQDHALRIGRGAWDACRLGAVFLEPGTVRGFDLIRKLRDLGPVIAPCPRPGPCPVTAGDWCHFAQRVERSSLHRRLKEGTLGHEDEKYSYAILAREHAGPTAGARVVRHPRHNPGFIELRLCEDGALRNQTVTRSQKAQFRAARKAEWGSLLFLDGQVIDDAEHA